MMMFSVAIGSDSLSYGANGKQEKRSYQSEENYRLLSMTFCEVDLEPSG